MPPKLGRGQLFFRIFILLVVAGVFGAFVAVQTRDDTLPDPTPPNVNAPTLEQLTSSIELAEQYLDRLYKTGDGMAVQSEYLGLPIRIFTPGTSKWSLLGEDDTSSIVPGPSDRVSEAFTVSFLRGAVTMLIRTTWQEGSSDFSITIQPETVRATADVWIDGIKLGTLRPGVTNRITSPVLNAANYATLASHRYTIRHATQQALYYWRMRGDQEKARKVEEFLKTNGFNPGFDMRAVIFGKSQPFSDDLPYDRNAYQDCSHLPPSGVLAYPYKSKACKVLGVYFTAAERDPFLQATQALHVLQKHKDPEREYDVSIVQQQWIQGDTPKETAEHLRYQWGRTAVGIPACTPLDCQSVASGIRTFVYGALEAELGYHYGDPVATRFADAAALRTIIVQIHDGYIHMPTGDVYRPAHTGSFIMYWDKQNRFAPPDPSLLGALALTLIDEAAMPPEYLGIVPSNSETTFDAWAFLVRYRCLKYVVGCAEGP